MADSEIISGKTKECINVSRKYKDFLSENKFRLFEIAFVFNRFPDFPSNFVSSAVRQSNFNTGVTKRRPTLQQIGRFFGF
jgi:hypothetical protein